jgi:[histone H3]-N6,N6-dimethyl-L-lysine4 FAD-dependent demethylase
LHAPVDALLEKKSISVAVVGAGMSGLMVALQLQQFGYSVTIVEARNRPGGRVHTSLNFGGAIDMGASVVTGLLGNPLKPLCAQLNTRLHALK